MKEDLWRCSSIGASHNCWWDLCEKVRTYHSSCNRKFEKFLWYCSFFSSLALYLLSKSEVALIMVCQFSKTAWFVLKRVLKVVWFRHADVWWGWCEIGRNCHNSHKKSWFCFSALIFVALLLFFHIVSWSYRIHWLHLCREIRLPPP